MKENEDKNIPPKTTIITDENGNKVEVTELVQGKPIRQDDTDVHINNNVHKDLEIDGVPGRNYKDTEDLNVTRNALENAHLFDAMMKAHNEKKNNENLEFPMEGNEGPAVEQSVNPFAPNGDYEDDNMETFKINDFLNQQNNPNLNQNQNLNPNQNLNNQNFNQNNQNQNNQNNQPDQQQVLNSFGNSLKALYLAANKHIQMDDNTYSYHAQNILNCIQNDSIKNNLYQVNNIEQALRNGNVMTISEFTAQNLRKFGFPDPMADNNVQMNMNNQPNNMQQNNMQQNNMQQNNVQNNLNAQIAQLMQQQQMIQQQILQLQAMVNNPNANMNMNQNNPNLNQNNRNLNQNNRNLNQNRNPNLNNQNRNLNQNNANRQNRQRRDSIRPNNQNNPNRQNQPNPNIPVQNQEFVPRKGQKKGTKTIKDTYETRRDRAFRHYRRHLAGYDTEGHKDFKWNGSTKERNQQIKDSIENGYRTRESVKEEFTENLAERSSELSYYARELAKGRKSHKTELMVQDINAFDDFMKEIDGRTRLTADELEAFDMLSLQAYNATMNYQEYKDREVEKRKKKAESNPKNKETKDKEDYYKESEKVRLEGVKEIQNGIQKLREDMFKKEIEEKKKEMQEQIEEQLDILQEERENMAQLATQPGSDGAALRQQMENNIAKTLSYGIRMEDAARANAFRPSPGMTLGQSLKKLDAYTATPHANHLEQMKKSPLFKDIVDQAMEKAKNGQTLSVDEVDAMKKKSIQAEGNKIRQRRLRKQNMRQIENHRGNEHNREEVLQAPGM